MVRKLKILLIRKKGNLGQDLLAQVPKNKIIGIIATNMIEMKNVIDMKCVIRMGKMRKQKKVDIAIKDVMKIVMTDGMIEDGKEVDHLNADIDVIVTGAETATGAAATIKERKSRRTDIIEDETVGSVTGVAEAEAPLTIVADDLIQINKTQN